MPKGGARTRSGPAPDPEALRRERDAGEWTILPFEGRQGATPNWPLSEQSDREAVLWESLWCKPQALMWERYDQGLEVALYVRRLGEAEKPGSPVVLSTLVRQMADSLGLTTPGLRGNRWRIDRAADERDQVDDRRDSLPAPSSARARLRAVAGGSG
ncbi:hypothetical protein [Streptomyces lavendulocolor]|uniref:hypothetical protein n=1 Tax=Streptomyces lavendulocolor TaxID=67316 RepID=UPI003F4D41FF